MFLHGCKILGQRSNCRDAATESPGMDLRRLVVQMATLYYTQPKLTKNLRCHQLSLIEPFFVRIYDEATGTTF